VGLNAPRYNSRLAIAAATAALGLVGAIAPAMAAEPVPATISTVQMEGGAITGILTVRKATGAEQIDGASLKAVVAGKSYPVSVRPVSQSKRATMLVVDTSGSMGASGMATVRAAVAAFLAEAPKDVAIGLVSFAGTAGIDVLPTTNRAKVQKAVNSLRSRGETTLYDAVSVAAQAMGPYDDRSIILLSDGGDTRSTKASRASATASLQRHGVRAEVVAFKTADSDNSVLAGFATAGGGSVAQAGDSDAVKTAFQAAARALESQVNFMIRPDVGVGGKEQVRITGSVGGAQFRAVTLVDLGAVPVASSPPAKPVVSDGTAALAKLTAPTGTRPWLLGAAAAVFLGVLGLSAGLVSPMFRSGSRRRVETIERYVAPGTTIRAERPSSVSASSLSAGLVDIGERFMEGRESTGKTMALIERADLPLRAGEWWVLRIVSIVVGVAAVMLFLPGDGLVKLGAGTLGALLGLGAPAFILRFLAKRRSKKFEAQLPDVLMLVASSLSTGFSLLQALDAVAKDAAEPAAKEFSRALAETRIGSDIDDALERMAVRTNSDNMRWTAMAIRIQREVGGNLAETLRTTAQTLRERESLKRHVRALSAEGRLSAYILIALPLGIFLYTYNTNHDYIELLWTKPLGLAMLGGGVVSMVIGIFWMRKVVDVQV
jgi:tight adherence protein B